MLHVELIEHIRRSLPAVRRELSQKLNLLRKDVKLMDQMMGFNKEGSNGVQVFMQKLVFMFIEDMQTKLIGHSESVGVNELKAGALINFKIYSNLKKIMKMPTSLNSDEFMNLIANVHGIRNILSVPSIALEAACAKILEKYKLPIENLVDAIVDILILAVEESAALIYDYPCLKEHISRFINESIDQASEECKDMLEKNLESQMKCCNIYHWDLNICLWESNFSCSHVKVWSFEDDENNESTTSVDYDEDVEPTTSIDDGLSSFSKLISVKMMGNDNAKKNSQTLSDMIEKYILLVQKQIADTTYKYINVFLVHRVCDFIRKDLIINLMNFSGKDVIMQECEQEFERRNEMLDLSADLEEALAAVQSF
ncbi:GED domain-containing protein [Trichonephila clavata]|uniref:dynamin GTPase n=1 Tax=Trichonephila clavata TaxID=2740835 RepID=A0A8X6HVT3_TRICU|nr:GED domain-containing protein [Trichonephila clavata]